MPPQYDLSHIEANITLIIGKHERFSTVADAHRIRDELVNSNVNMIEINGTHVTYIWGKDMRYFDAVINILGAPRWAPWLSGSGSKAIPRAAKEEEEEGEEEEKEEEEEKTRHCRSRDQRDGLALIPNAERNSSVWKLMLGPCKFRTMETYWSAERSRGPHNLCQPALAYKVDVCSAFANTNYT